MQETQEMWFPSLGQEDPLEKEMATHSSILACEIPWTEEPVRLQSMGSQRVRQDWTGTHMYVGISESAVSWCRNDVFNGSCNPTDCSTPGFSSSKISHSLFKFMSIESVMLSNLLILCLPLLLSQHQGLFQWVISSHHVAKVLELHASASLSREYSGLIFFRMDCFDVLAVQGTLKSFRQYYNSIASILQHSNIAKC